jgi:multiple sugar transport system ATP-binding protein
VFVAGFIGSPAMNLLTAPHDGASVDISDRRFEIPREILQRASTDSVILGMRPEDLQLVGPDDGGLEMEVIMTEELGADAYIFGIPKGFDSLNPTIVRVDGRRPPMKGDIVHLVPNIDYLHVFDAETGLRLNEEVPEYTPHAQLADVEALQDEDA